MHKALASGGLLARHPFVRTAWARQGKRALLFIGGASYPMKVASAQVLAAATTIDGAQFAALDKDAQAAVIALAMAGSYVVRKPIGRQGRGRR